MILGSGWHVFLPEENVRATVENSEILIINPTNSEMYVTLNLVLFSEENEKTVTIYNNNKKLIEHNVPNAWTNIVIKNLMLEPGTNVITLDTDEFTPTKSTSEVSLVVQSISIIN